MAGDGDAAGKINEKIASLHELLFLEANPVPVKWALKEMGMIGPGIRLPLVELDTIYHEQLQKALFASGAIQV
jgi:4-hydroxy-tetrahydrodipicolinate synthase